MRPICCILWGLLCEVPYPERVIPRKPYTGLFSVHISKEVDIQNIKCYVLVEKNRREEEQERRRTGEEGPLLGG